MAVHGIISTYFGDLEYDIGKSFQWTQSLCKTVYVLDTNDAESSRQYVVDWDRFSPQAKYSFYSGKSFFGSPQTAADWRKESFTRALAAWNYNDDDWVLFIDGTEALNVFNPPSLDRTLTKVAIDGTTGDITLTTSTAHGASVGNYVSLDLAVISIPGVTGDTYSHTQSTVSTTWTITHNLNSYPTITSLTSSVSPTPDYLLSYTDLNTAVITFDTATSGSVDLKAPDILPEQPSLDGIYKVTSVPSTTTLVVKAKQEFPTVVEQTLENPALLVVSFEPDGFFEGFPFESWFNREINDAVAAGKTMISLDGWALIRSGAPIEVLFKLNQPSLAGDIPNVVTDILDGSKLVGTPFSEEYYVSMNRMVRLVKVSTLKQSNFDWTLLDQPQVTISSAHPATSMSLISYAYVRWAESPLEMTQAVDPDAPNYVAGDALDPPFRPLTITADVGFAMRRLISTVRPLTGVPLVWTDADPDGTQPMVGSTKKLDATLIEKVVAGEFAGYRPYGGTPLYETVLRLNLREGVWYVKQDNDVQVSSVISSISYENGIVTVTTPSRHYISSGAKIMIFGINSGLSTSADAYGLYEGQFVVLSVPTPNTFTYKRSSELSSVAPISTPLGQVHTIPKTYGPVRWNYLLNSFGVIGDPDIWINSAFNKQSPS